MVAAMWGPHERSPERLAGSGASESVSGGQRDGADHRPLPVASQELVPIGLVADRIAQRLARWREVRNAT